MAKWADYTISAVHYDSDHDRIKEVEIREDTGESLGAPTKMLREKVVKEIQDGTTFVTAFKKGDKWYKGRCSRNLSCKW